MSTKTIRNLRRTAGVLAACLLACALTALAANYPPWWTSRGVINTAQTLTNDYGVVNAGQLKWFASKAKDELDARLPGGAGSNVNALVASFTSSNNYALVNLGQLKYVAKPFYDRLIAVGYTNTYPWTTNTVADDRDFAIAIVGQLKTIFNFDVSQMVFIPLPVASNDNYSIDEDTTLNVFAPGILANDYDPEDDNITALLVTGIPGLTLNSNGSFSYTPPANWFGVTSFTYHASDTMTTSAIAIVTITVNPVNDAPSCTLVSPLNNTTIRIGPPTITLRAIASDLDGNVAKVEFYHDGVLLGEDLTPPYTYDWSLGDIPPVTDPYALTAKATDNSGLVTTSSTVNISVDHNLPVGTRLYYDFNNNTNAVTDLSGYNHTGTVLGATWISNGVIDGAFSFDGTNDRISAGTSSDLSFNGTQPFSLSLWMNIRSTSRSQTVFGRSSPVGDPDNYMIMNSGNTLLFGWYNPPANRWLLSTQPITPNTWYNIMTTWNGTNAALYINGELNTSTNMTAPPLGNTKATVVGNREGLDTYAFGGLIDDVFVFNTTLSAVDAGALFYRKTILPDTDGDGLADAVEHNVISDAYNPFTDASVMSDGWLWLHFGALDVDPSSDPDGDGLSNLEEFLRGCDPNVSDLSILDPHDIVGLNMHTPLEP